MPVELLVGVLFISVLVNAALLVWLSRADHIRIHWPRHFRPIADLLQSPGPQPSRDTPTVRRRPIFVADNESAHGAALAASVPFTTVPLPAERGPLSQTLPPDLADFLSRPAAIAPTPDGSRFSLPGEGRGATSAYDPTAAGSSVSPGPAPGGMARDPLTGLEGPAGWSRIMETENARLLRYRRPVTVVMAEVEGLRRLAEKLGQEPVDRLLPVIADAFRREARSSDWVARIGDARFAAFLPETDESQAVNYVERIRLVCDPWLYSAAVPLRLAIGWSSPSASSDMEFALQRAEDRMHGDRRMPAKPTSAPRSGPARVVSVSGTHSGEPAPQPDGADSVPPAETGRVREDADLKLPPEHAPEARFQDVSIGKGRRKASRAKPEPGRDAKP